VGRGPKQEIEALECKYAISARSAKGRVRSSCSIARAASIPVSASGWYERKRGKLAALTRFFARGMRRPTSRLWLAIRKG